MDRTRSFLGLFTSFLLAACGGGGGSTPETGPRIVDINKDAASGQEFEVINFWVK